MNLKWTDSLSSGMPDELLRLKYSGYFDEFKERSKYHLSRPDLPDVVKQRLELELYKIEGLKKAYIIDEDELFESLCEFLPGFTRDDFEKLRPDFDWIFVEGEKKYVNFSLRALFLASPMLRDWPGSTYEYSDNSAVEKSVSQMIETGKASVEVEVMMYCDVDCDESKGNELRVHMPYPNVDGYGLKSVELIDSSHDGRFSDYGFHQNTYFMQDSFIESDYKNFWVKFKTVTETDYMSFDKLSASYKPGEYACAVRESDLGEKVPGFVFSPFIKALSEKIVGKETDKLKIAKKIYDYIVVNYEYSYVRDYALLDSLGEYFALRGRGDCGLQTSLFITLCRYNTIPARWQSGIVLGNDGGGVHDWACIYIDGIGYRPVDCSYGAHGRFCKNLTLQEFYFGNVDPYRVPFNTDVQQEFDPPKNFYRYDPYDNQYGEVETDVMQVPESKVNMGRNILKCKQY